MRISAPTKASVRRLGRRRPQSAIERFERVGYSVVQGASDWVFAPQDREIQIEILSGWAAAAREIGELPLPDVDRLADAPARPCRRRTLIDPRRSRRFLRAADRARAEPTGRSRTAPRRRAGARCIGVSSASSTRAIGGSVKLGRPEPRMIGATMMCRRSRHFAARKRETVSAPPSISMRRKPRSASAARIAAGAICPSVLGEADDLDVGRQRRPRARAGDHQAAHAIVGETAWRRRKPPFGIDDDPRRLRAGDAPHGELRIVGERRSDPDHHGIHQRPQPVQMGKPRRPVDVVRMSGFGRDAAVQRLADLADHHEFVDPAMPQRAEQVLPRLPAAGRSAPETPAGTGVQESIS